MMIWPVRCVFFNILLLFSRTTTSPFLDWTQKGLRSPFILIWIITLCTNTEPRQTRTLFHTIYTYLLHHPICTTVVAIVCVAISYVCKSAGPRTAAQHRTVWNIRIQQPANYTSPFRMASSWGCWVVDELSLKSTQRAPECVICLCVCVCEDAGERSVHQRWNTVWEVLFGSAQTPLWWWLRVLCLMQFKQSRSWMQSTYIT